ncbi:hypothetical protein DVH24_002018, partial [Malus domestica]
EKKQKPSLHLPYLSHPSIFSTAPLFSPITFAPFSNHKSLSSSFSYHQSFAPKFSHPRSQGDPPYSPITYPNLSHRKSHTAATPCLSQRNCMRWVAAMAGRDSVEQIWLDLVSMLEVPIRGGSMSL